MAESDPSANVALLNVLSFLGGAELGRMQLSSRAFYVFAAAPELWRDLCLRRLGFVHRLRFWQPPEVCDIAEMHRWHILALGRRPFAAAGPGTYGCGSTTTAFIARGAAATSSSCHSGLFRTMFRKWQPLASPWTALSRCMRSRTGLSSFRGCWKTGRHARTGRTMPT
eukprot:scaffold7363_cov263-Pinguiococcus_pyrenoidosus.AAC.25